MFRSFWRWITGRKNEETTVIDPEAYFAKVIDDEIEQLTPSPEFEEWVKNKMADAENSSRIARERRIAECRKTCTVPCPGNAATGGYRR